MRRGALTLGFVAVATGLLLAMPSPTQEADQSDSGFTLTADEGSDNAAGRTDDLAPTSAPTSSVVTTTAPAETTGPTSPTSATSFPPTATTPVARILDAGEPADQELQIEVAFSSEIADVTTDELATFALATLNDPRSWGQAGFRFTANPDSALTVILAEGSRVDELCRPLNTRSNLSCQNGPVVALNANRWREATTTWDATVEDYRRYLVNHEVGHLIGQRHPTPRCPVPGAPAAVMEQQTKGLEGCVGNSWPRPWEITYARARPAKIGPLPAWAPDPIPANVESTTG